MRSGLSRAQRTERAKPVKSVSASLPVSVPLSLAIWAAILTIIF